MKTLHPTRRSLVQISLTALGFKVNAKTEELRVPQDERLSESVCCVILPRVQQLEDEEDEKLQDVMLQREAFLLTSCSLPAHHTELQVESRWSEFHHGLQSPADWWKAEKTKLSSE